MILLIDAYNVLKQIIASGQATAQEKKDFIAIICLYARLKNVSIELVFDGGPYGLSDCLSLAHVAIRHSGSQESADDVIKSLILSYKGRDLLLISTDRELGRYALSQGVNALDSIDFYRFLRKAVDTVELPQEKVFGELVKSTDTRDFELDELMAESTIALQQKRVLEEKKSTLRNSCGKKLSKKERQLKKKIRKL